MKTLPSFQRTTVNRLLPLVIAVATTGLPLPAVAQDSAGLEEVTVIASRLKGDTQAIPIAISSFNNEQLEELSVTQLQDLTHFTPGLTATPGPNGGNEGLFYIRGIGQNDGNAATDPGVATYLDGVYLGRTAGASLDTLDIATIDVLRGPQGTLFGRNTIGGAISVQTMRPDTEQLSGKVKGGVMNRDGYKMQLITNVPLNDQMALRVSGMNTQQDGWGDSVYTNDTYGDVDTTSGRARLLWEAADNLEFLLSLDGTRARGTSQPTVLTAFDGSMQLPHRGASPLAVPFPTDMGAERSNNPKDIFSSIDPKNDMDVWGTALQVNWDLDWGKIASITSYRDLNSYTTQDFDGGGYAFYDNFMDQDQDQTSQELLFSGQAMDNKLDWLVGLYWFKENVEYTNAINMGTNTNLFPFTWQKLDGRGLRNNQNFNLDVESEAAFFDLRYAFTEQWALTLGGRYNYEKKEQAFDMFIDNRQSIFSFIPAPFPGNPPWPNPGYVQLFTPGVITPTLSPDNPFLPPNVPTKYDDDWTKFTPRAVLDFAANDALMFYGSFAQGFKSGGWNGRPQDTRSPVPTYEPEEVDTYELGMKSQWLDQQLEFNTAYFFSNYQDIQLLVVNPASGFFETSNAAKAEVQGIEGELTAQITESFQVRWTGTWTDSKYTELSAQAQASGIDKDDELPLTPEFTTSLGAQYTFNLSAGGAIIPRADWVWQDRVYYGAANGEFESQDAYGLLNLRLTWESPEARWNVAAYVLNANDKEYYSNGQDVVEALGVAFAGVGRPREYGLDVTYSF